MKTTEPNAPFLDSLSGVWIIQQASVSKIPLDGNVSKNPYWTTPGQAVGTGPFKISGYQQGTFMELWRFDQISGEEPRSSTRSSARNTRTLATALLALDKGEVDLAYVTADEVQREQGNTSVRIIAGDSGVDNVITFNPLINPVFDKVEFRQAMAYAIDRQTIIDTSTTAKARFWTASTAIRLTTAPNSITTTIPTRPSRSCNRRDRRDKAAGIHLRHVLHRPAVPERHDAHSEELGGRRSQGEDPAGGQRRVGQGLLRRQVRGLFSGTGSGPDGNIASIYFDSAAAYPAPATTDGPDGRTRTPPSIS